MEEKEEDGRRTLDKKGGGSKVKELGEEGET